MKYDDVVRISMVESFLRQNLVENLRCIALAPSVSYVPKLVNLHTCTLITLINSSFVILYLPFPWRMKMYKFCSREHLLATS